MDVCAATLDEMDMDIGGWWRGIEPKPRAPGQNVPSGNENDSDIDSINKGNDNYSIMAKAKISATTAEDYGLDQEEADIALRYAAAAKQATQGSLTAPPDEAKRLNNIARLWKLALELCLRLKVAVQLPLVLKTKQQSDFAGQLAGNSQELRKLEKILFGEPHTPQNDLVKKAETRRRAYQRAHPEPETPTTPRPGGGESSNLAA